jgi:serine protease inhibitor
MDRRSFLAGTGAVVAAGLPAMAAPSSSLSPSSSNILQAQNRLGRQLVDYLRTAQGGGQNIVISPASVSSILAILDLIVDPKLQSAIHAALGFDRNNANASSDLEKLRALASETRNGLGEGTKFTLANAIVADRALSIGTDRLRAAGVELFSDVGPQVVQQVNDWVSRQTEGAIPKVLAGPPGPHGAVAVNAMYFKSLWRDRFDPALTRLQPFHQGSGAVQVAMMSHVGSRRMRSAGRFVAVDLSYRSDRFSLALVTTTDKPASAGEFAEVFDWLGGEEFGAETVQLSLPRFTLHEGAELLPALDAMGLKAARVSQPGVMGSLSSVLQRTYLQIDEEGTKAAAATAVVMSRMANRSKAVKVAFDKPFIFSLRDRSTGLVLLTGYVGRLPVSAEISKSGSHPANSAAPS